MRCRLGRWHNTRRCRCTHPISCHTGACLGEFIGGILDRAHRFARHLLARHVLRRATNCRLVLCPLAPRELFALYIRTLHGFCFGAFGRNCGARRDRRGIFSRSRSQSHDPEEFAAHAPSRIRGQCAIYPDFFGHRWDARRLRRRLRWSAHGDFSFCLIDIGHRR